MTATAADFELGTTVSFSTYASAILGAFEKVKIEGIVDYNVVRQFIDPATLHANVYGSLPVGEVPDDFTKYYYLVLMQSNGNKTAIGLPWVDETTIQLIASTTVIITVDNAGVNDLPSIKEALAINGFTSVDVRIE